MTANLENSAVAAGLESVMFHSNQKNSMPKNVQTTTHTLISHTSKVMLRILQARLQQNVNCELPDVQAGFKKAEESDIKLPTSAGSSKSKRIPGNYLLLFH